MMRRFGIYGPLIAILVVVTLPAAGMSIMYYFTQNPNLRPLSITQEKLAAIENPDRSALMTVHVDWGQELSGTATKADLRDLVAGVLGRRTDNYTFKFNDVPGDRIGVTIVVGPNRYGPYPPNQIMNGIVPALVALDMTLKANS